MKYLLEDQQTTRLYFRRISINDFSEWLPFFEDPQAQRYWISAFKPPRQACEEWYQWQQRRYHDDQGGMNALVEIDSGKLVGHAGLLVQTVDGKQEMEIAYSLLPHFWGNGYATEAAQKCRDYAFKNNFSESLISIISVTNIPSIRVAIKNGMVADGETIYKNNAVTIFRVVKDRRID